MNNSYGLSWKGAVLLSLVSFIIVFPCFLVYEVIWGDLIRGILDPALQVSVYTKIDIALFIGFLFALLICACVNLVLYRQYTFLSKLRANMYALIMTIVILYFISFFSMFYLFPDASIFYIIVLFPYYLVYFTVYVLQTPILFWLLAMIIYHVSLILFYKFLLVRKTSSFQIKKNQQVYQTRIL